MDPAEAKPGQELMDHDAEHLRLLAIFHYVVGGFAALCCFFPLIYVAMGFIFINLAHQPVPKQGEPPPELLGWFFIAFGAIFFLGAVAVASGIILSGRYLSQRRRYWFSFVTACIECIFMPFGTALGIFTIIVLSRESVKKQFGVESAAS